MNLWLEHPFLDFLLCYILPPCFVISGLWTLYIYRVVRDPSNRARRRRWIGSFLLLIGLMFAGLSWVSTHFTGLQGTRWMIIGITLILMTCWVLIGLAIWDIIAGWKELRNEIRGMMGNDVIKSKTIMKGPKDI